MVTFKFNVMNNLRNRVQLIGHVGNTPEVKNFGDGKTVARLNIATNEVYINKEGEKVTETQWHNLVAWGKNAKFIEKYLNKGQEIAIEGKLTSRSWDDKDGVKRYVTEVVVNEMMMIGSKK